ALLGQWLPGRGVELYDEPVIEIYLNNPEDTAPQDLLSEICVRIQN
ncbi:MAG: GyrI-like domain-containing protein, partial [Myxococcota bacterium]